MRFSGCSVRTAPFFRSADRGDADSSEKGLFILFLLLHLKAISVGECWSRFSKAAASKSPLVVLFEAPPAQETGQLFATESSNHERLHHQPATERRVPSSKRTSVDVAESGPCQPCSHRDLSLNSFGLGPPCLAPNPVSIQDRPTFICLLRNAAQPSPEEQGPFAIVITQH